MKKKKNKVKFKKMVTKRIKVTKNGKVLRMSAFKRHLNAKKSKKRLGRLKRVKQVSSTLGKKLKKYLGK